MIEVYIDFEGAGADRNDIRRMAKQLKKTSFFDRAEGKRLYFKINRAVVSDAFLLSCSKILNDDGFIIELVKK